MGEQADYLRDREDERRAEPHDCEGCPACIAKADREAFLEMRADDEFILADEGD